MSWKATAYVKPLTAGPRGDKLTRSEKLLLMIIADYHHDKKRCAWASAKTLAGDSLLSVRYVQMLTKSIRLKGVICLKRQAGEKGDFDPNTYYFHALDCDGDHEPGSILGDGGGAPEKEGGYEKSSLPPLIGGSVPLRSPDRNGTDPQFVTGGEPGIVTVTKTGASLYKDEPQSKPQEVAATHTHAAEPTLFDAGVCVSSDLTFEDFRGFARANPSSFTNPDAWARKHFPLRDPLDEQLVREWKASRERARLEAAPAEPPRSGKRFAIAASEVSSFAASGVGDVAAYIATLDVDEDVRARLVETFVTKGAMKPGA